MSEPRKAKEDVPAWEVRATGSGLAVWRICFERRLEPRAAELPRNDGPIAGEESVQRPTVEYARRQGRGKVACDHVCGCWLDRQSDGDNSPLFHRYVVSVWASWRPRLQLRVAIDRSGTGGRATMFNAGLFRAPAFPHDSISSPPSANPTREAGFHGVPTSGQLNSASQAKLAARDAETDAEVVKFIFLSNESRHLFPSSL